MGWLFLRNANKKITPQIIFLNTNYNYLEMTYGSNGENAAPAGLVNRKILKPYVDWRIKVEIINGKEYFYEKGSRGTLVELGSATVLRENGYVREEFASVRWENWYKEWVPIRDILPVLRPFSALCKPLPNGTMPSVEIANLITAEPQFYNRSYLSKIIKNKLCLKDSIGIFLPSVDGVSVISYDDWHDLCDESEKIVHYRVYDYLYFEHFAVGLKRNQFIDLI